MNVPTYVWVLTVVCLVGIMMLDLVLVDSRPHVFGVKDATRWVIFYIVLALLFAVGVGVTAGAEYAGQFLAGYITEYSLSVDNLFVFLVIMSSFAVPAEFQHRVLLIGVLIALFLRGILIVVGAAALEEFAGLFYLFGAILIYTGIKLFKEKNEAPEPGENKLIRFVERFMPTTREYHGTKMSVVLEGGKRALTPMALVILAIGTTDLIFALDSIPAIFGLTQEAYLVFAANAFALMGLRQLYFLLNGLLDRLVYLSYGLAVILLFIGVKLVFHAMHVTGTLWADAPEISTATSLIVIIGVLVITTVASLLKVREDPDAMMTRAVESERAALAHQGEELLRLHEEVLVAHEAVEHHVSSGAPEPVVAAAIEQAEQTLAARTEAVAKLDDLAAKAPEDALPALPPLPKLAGLESLANRAPQVFDDTLSVGPQQRPDGSFDGGYEIGRTEPELTDSDER